MNPALLRIAVWTGAVGFVLSLAVHLASFTDVAVPDAAVGLHVGVFVAFAPVLIALMMWGRERGYDMNDFRSQWAFQKELLGLLTGWQKLAVAGLVAYTAVNFVSGVAAVATAPDSELSVRLFSGHWMFFYFVSAVFAKQLVELQRPAEPTRGERHPTDAL